MRSSLLKVAEQPTVAWRLPLVPETYDRSPLTDKEVWALQVCVMQCRRGPASREAASARRILVRLDAPIADVFSLRYKGKCLDALPSVQRIMRSEMHRLGKVFWEWSVQDWFDALCPTVALFEARHGKKACTHIPIMDAAYLLGGVTDLRPVGMGLHAASAANVYFGAELIDAESQRLFGALVGKGFKDGRTSVQQLRKGLCMLFLLNRSPSLEDISAELLAAVSAESVKMRQVTRRITVGLQSLQLLPARLKDVLPLPIHLSSNGMTKEWHAWYTGFAHSWNRKSEWGERSRKRNDDLSHKCISLPVK